MNTNIATKKSREASEKKLARAPALALGPIFWGSKLHNASCGSELQISNSKVKKVFIHKVFFKPLNPLF